MMPPNKVALLVIDMQEGFRLCGEALLPELNKTIKFSRSKKMPVLFTQHGHRYPKLDGGCLIEQWGVDELILYGSEKWQFIGGLDVAPTDVQIVEKRRYDAFHGTLLDNILKKMDVDTLVVSGVMTNLCCETTARTAFNLDYRVIFLSDGCGTSSPEMHKATLLNIQFGFGRVMTCEEFRKSVENNQ